MPSHSSNTMAEARNGNDRRWGPGSASSFVINPSAGEAEARASVATNPSVEGVDSGEFGMQCEEVVQMLFEARRAG